MSTLLILAAVLCFVLATFGVSVAGHELIAPGLALWAGAALVSAPLPWPARGVHAV